MIDTYHAFVDKIVYIFCLKLSQKPPFLVIGLDEAGRGPLAGPVTAAAVCFAPGYENHEIKDSKKLSPAKREKLFSEITKAALAWTVISVGPRRIEQINIREASKLAMILAANRNSEKLTRQGFCSTLLLLIDGNMLLETNFYEETIIKGDQKLLAIEAASIVAKVSRDRLMVTLDKHYPGYDFSVHKGYPTARHRGSLQAYGPSRIHRQTFAGVCADFAPWHREAGRGSGALISQEKRPEIPLPELEM